MLNLSLAPAQFFQSRLNQVSDLSFTPGQPKEAISLQKQPLRGLSRQNPPFRDAAFTEKFTSSSIFDIFQGITPEQFVNRIVGDDDNNVTGVTKESGHRLSFNLRIKYRAEIDHIKRPQSHTEGRPSSKTVQRSIFRKYNATSYLQAQQKSRTAQANLFFKRTEQFTSQIRSVHVEDYRGVRNKIAAAFQYDLSLDFRFLQQFHDQSKQLKDHGEEVFNGYVNTTDALMNRSVAMTKSFFDAVDDILDSSHKRFLAHVEQFFNDLRSVYREKVEFIEKDKEVIISQVTSFFDRVQHLLDDAERNELAPYGEPDALNSGNVQLETVAPDEVNAPQQPEELTE